MVGTCNDCGTDTWGKYKLCPDCRRDRKENEKKECEICGRTIRGAGRKYCSYCRNSEEARKKEEEVYLPSYNPEYKDRTETPPKRDFNWKAFFSILFVIIIIWIIFNIPFQKKLNNKDNPSIINDTISECQYKEQQDTGKTINYIQDNLGNNYTTPLEVRDFSSQGRCPSLGCIGGSPCTCKVSFIVRNNINNKVTLKLQYSVVHNRIAGSSIGSTEIHQEEKEITLNPLEDYFVTNEYSDYCDDQECSVNTNSIREIFITNDETISKVDKIYQEVCKQCKGIDCLNDGQNCSSDVQCGSGICNIVGVCGTQKIVGCFEGFRNCNNESCLESNIKKVGEPYSCEFECKSNYGENGICKTPLKEKIFKFIFIIFFLLISALIVYLIWSDKKLTEIVRELKIK